MKKHHRSSLPSPAFRQSSPHITRSIALAVASVSLYSVAQAAPATFNATPVDNNFATDANWTPAAAPGVADGTLVNTDTATFNQTVTNGIGVTGNPLLIDANRNLQNITFSTAAASPYVIGKTGGNALLLTSGGTIQTTATVANIETVNAPLVLEPASAATAGTYTFSSNAALPANTLNFGGNITVGATNGAGALGQVTLNLSGTNTGANTLGGTITQSTATTLGGLQINKATAATWTFGASGGSGSSTLQKGQLRSSAGTFNFATAASDTTSLAFNGNTAAGGNVGVYILGGIFNMKGGTITTLNTQQGLVVQGTGTIFNQTGGLVTTNADLIEFANNGSTTQNISAGELRTANRIELNTNGTSSTTNLSGTGLITTPTLLMLTNQTNNNASTSTFNLGTFSTNGGVTGGTLATGVVAKGTSTGTGVTTFNFDGGTLRATTANNLNFFSGMTTANVRNGGAIIDTQTFNDTINQPLLHFAGATTDSLTKLGGTTAANGILTLTGTNTYTGGTTVQGGSLTVSGAAATLGSGNVSVLGTAITLTISAGVVDAIANSADVFLAGGGTVGTADFGFLTLGNGVNELVNSLFLNGQLQPTGTYGAVGSGATFQNNEYFSGAGILTTAVPEPSTWAAMLIGMGALVGLQSRRKRS